MHRLLWQTYVVENFYTVGELPNKYFGALEKSFSLKGKRNLATWKKIGKFSTQFLEIRLKHHRTSPVVNFHLDLTNKQFLTPLYRFQVENLKKIDSQKLYYGSKFKRCMLFWNCDSADRFRQFSWPNLNSTSKNSQVYFFSANFKIS